jgi:methionine-rich copper-binding protein CopC
VTRHWSAFHAGADVQGWRGPTRAQRSSMVARVAFRLAAACLWAPVPLYAHAHLTKSQPGANETLMAPPDAIRLWFSERPEIALTVVAPRDESGEAVGLGASHGGAATPLEIDLAHLPS